MSEPTKDPKADWKEVLKAWCEEWETYRFPLGRPNYPPGLEPEIPED